MAAGAPSPIEVRELRRSEIDAWEPILRQAIGTFERSTWIDQSVDTQMVVIRRAGIWALLSFLRLMGRAPVRIVVAADHDRLVGTALVLFYPKSGYISGVATDTSARGRGVATKVLERTHALARARGRRWSVLDVEDDNETAIRLYRRLGYRDVAEVAWFTGPLPDVPPVPAPTATEVKAPDRALIAWVDALRPAEVRAALPASPGYLSHLETIPAAPRRDRRTWVLAPDGRTSGVVRTIFKASIATGYVFPHVAPTADTATRLALLAPTLAAQKARGGQRVVVAVPTPADAWEAVLPPLGLARVVTTRTMLLPLAA